MIPAAILLSLASTATAAAPAGSSARLEADAQAVDRAVTALKPHLDNIWPDRKPGTARLITAQWQAMQRWAADWLDAHPGANGAALVKASTRFGDDWSISSVRLSRDDVLVSAARWQIGNAFILTRGSGRYRVRWSTADPQISLNTEADRNIASWRVAVQPTACGDCVMMGGASVGRLPATAHRAMRFWMVGGFAREMGATGGVQFTIWSWRNGRARPLLWRTPIVMADQRDPMLRGSTLIVPTKGDWSSIFACGACFGRTIDLRFAVGPRGVRELPAIRHTPELDLIDRVFARILARRPVGDLASPAATIVIRQQLRDTLAQKDPQLRSLVGMVDGWQRWTVRGERWVCLNDDGTGPMAFAFDPKLTRVTAARTLPDGSCDGKGTHD